MKILQIYKTYLTESLGGVEQMMAQLAIGTQKLGVSSRILCLSKNPHPAKISELGVDIFRYQQLFDIASTGFSLTAINGFRQLAQWADIIHYHYPWPFGDVLHFLGNIKKPTLVTYHSDIVRQQLLLKCYRPLQHAFFKQMDAIVATSPNYVASSDALKRYTEKVKVIPLGLDPQQYPSASPERLNQWCTQLGEKFFLFVGVLRYYKGLSILLDACRKTTLPVVIVGSGPMEAELKTTIQRENLSHVTLLGKLPDEDKIALLQLCTAFVFPSHLRSEAFGLSLLEAAMFAKPLISCEIGTGTSYINIDQQTGFVVPPNNPEALQQAMEKLWGNPNLAKQMGDAAYQRYLQLFTAEKMCAQYFQLYEILLRK